MAFLKCKLGKWYSRDPTGIRQAALLDKEDELALQEPSAVNAAVQAEDGVSCSSRKFLMN